MAFIRTVKLAELPAGTIRELQVEGKAVAVANVGGKIYAINNTCLHRGGPLGQGSLEGNVVTTGAGALRLPPFRGQCPDQGGRTGRG